MANRVLEARTLRAMMNALVDTPDADILELSIDLLPFTPDDLRFVSRYTAKTADRSVRNLLANGDDLLDAPNLRAFRARALHVLKSFIEQRMQSRGAEIMAVADREGVGHAVARSSMRDLVGWSNLSPAELASFATLSGREFLRGARAPVTAERRQELERLVRERVESFSRTRRAVLQAEIDEGLASKPPPPEAPAARLAAALLAIRKTLREVVEPQLPGRPTLRIQVSPDLRADVDDATPQFDGRFTSTSLKVPLDPPVAPYCLSCGPRPCEHALRAIDAVLRTIHAAPDDPTRKVLLEALARPAWERALGVVTDGDAGPGDEPAAQLVWSIGGFGRQIFPAPMVIRPAATGRQPRPKRIGWSEVMDYSSSFRHPADHDLAMIGQALGDTVPTMPPEFGVRLVSMLAGHPHLISRGNPDRPTSVVTRKLEALFIRTERGIEIRPSVDGEVVEISAIDLTFPLFGIPTKDEGVWRVVSVSSSVAKLLGAARTHDVFVPDSDLPRFVSLAPKLHARAEVRFPVELLGQAEPSRPVPVAQLYVSGKALVANARVRIHPNGLALTPGQGEAHVVVAAGSHLVLVSRDLEAEKRLVREALGSVLRIPQSGWTSRYEDRDEALDVMSALETSGVRSEWPADRWKLGSIGSMGTRVQVSDRKDWFGIEGSTEVDGRAVALALVLDAVRAGQRYVEIAPGEFGRIEETLRKTLGDLEPHVRRVRDRLEVALTAAGALAQIDNVFVDSARFRAAVQRVDEVRGFDPALPTGLEATLRPYQLEGFRWLSKLAELGFGGCLADDMGLGKTVQAIAVLMARSQGGPALVVAPTSVGFNWIREINRFGPSLHPTLYGGSDREAVLETLGPSDVLVVSYGLLARDIERLTARRFHTMVLDEAHAVKNPQTQRAKSVRKLQVDWRIALTGTPIENHLGELWSLFRVVEPGLLGSWEWFRERFAIPIERGRDPRARASLGRLLAPYVLRRRRSEVLDELPPKTEVRVDVTLAEDHRAIYESARIAALAKLGALRDIQIGDRERFIVLSALTLLRQICCDPRLDDPMSQAKPSKLDRLVELVTELTEEGQSTLIFSQFTRLLALVKSALTGAGIGYVYLDGSTSPAERERAVDEFQARKSPVFLISLKAGGLGLNLTAAENVIHLDPWWNPATEDQATGRAHRMGQTRPVTVYRLVTKGTIEDQIIELHAKKRELFSMVLDGADSAGSLSTDELIELIQKGPAEAPDEPVDEEADIVLDLGPRPAEESAEVGRSQLLLQAEAAEQGSSEQDEADASLESEAPPAPPAAAVAKPADDPTRETSVLRFFTPENLQAFAEKLDQEVRDRRLAAASVPIYLRPMERIMELGWSISELRSARTFEELQAAVTVVAGSRGFPASDGKAVGAKLRRFRELIEASGDEQRASAP
ncbi:MAG: DEAD/DEAH box helicase [Deltaproteobacteria bacterium]|nr:DEAD/DEAH box helicase [Deltaproteobacteria bacterium]